MPSALVDGKPADSIPVRDRGLSYGHGLFETIRMCRFEPLLWAAHMRRLQQGCAVLRIPFDEALEQAIRQDVRTLVEALADQALIDRSATDSLITDSPITNNPITNNPITNNPITNSPPTDNALIKVVITAGQSERGYSLPPTIKPSRIVSLYPAPPYPGSAHLTGVSVTSGAYRLPINPRLAGLKHLNRLDQVLARAELDNTPFQEVILSDTLGNVVEGGMSNLFAMIEGRLVTPELKNAGVRGVMRDYLLGCARQQNITIQEVNLPVENFKQAQELFLCNSVIGLWPVVRWDDRHFPIGDISRVLQRSVTALFTGSQVANNHGENDKAAGSGALE